ncbi:MAG: hypothetical protein ACHQ4H_01990 [Ktedonobacterales bacterium]
MPEPPTSRIPSDDTPDGAASAETRPGDAHVTAEDAAVAAPLEIAGAAERSGVAFGAQDSVAKGAAMEAREGAGEREARSERAASSLDEIETEADDDDDEAGFFHMLAEHMIHIRSMTPSLRLVTGFALGQLVAVALLIVLHPLMRTAISVGTRDNSTIQMPLVIFAACLVFLEVAWTFVLAGAFHAHWIVRLLLLGIFTYVFGFTPSPVANVHTAMLVILWAWALGVGLVDWRDASLRGEQSPLVRFLVERVPGATPLLRPLRSAAAALADVLRAVRARFPLPERVRLPLRTMLFVALWLLVYFGTLLASVDWGRGNTIFATTISLQLEALTFFLVPVLFLAGSDYAEIGEVLAGRVARITQRLRPAWPVVVLTGLTAAVILWRVLPDAKSTFGAKLVTVAGQLAIGAVLIAILALIVRWSRMGTWPKAPLPYIALVAGTVLFTVSSTGAEQLILAHQAPPSLLGPADYAVYQHTAPDFSIAYPAAWTPLTSDTPSAGTTAVIFNGVKSQYTGAMTVYSYPEVDGDLATRLETQFCPAQTCTLGSPVKHGAWSQISYSRGNAKGWFWRRQAGDRVYLVQVLTVSYFASFFAPTFGGIIDSWRADHSAHAPQPVGLTDEQAKRLIELVNAAAAALALLLGLGLILWGRRRGGYAALAGAFITTLGVLWLAFELQPVVQLTGLPSRHLGFSIPSVQLIIAVATLLTLGWLLIRRRLDARGRELLALLFALNAGLQFVAWFIDAFSQSAAVKLTVLQAIILIVGISWDVLMSGEQITNVDGRYFPRHVRLLIYLGYTMIVTTAVLYFATQTFTHTTGAVEPFFEDSQWPQIGLIFLGTPLLLTVFLLEIGRWWHARRSGLHARVPAHARAVPVAASQPAAHPE